MRDGESFGLGVALFLMLLTMAVSIFAIKKVNERVDELLLREPTQLEIMPDQMSKMLSPGLCNSVEVSHDFESGGYTAVCDWPGQPLYGYGKTWPEAWDNVYKETQRVTP